MPVCGGEDVEKGCTKATARDLICAHVVLGEDGKQLALLDYYRRINSSINQLLSE